MSKPRRGNRSTAGAPKRPRAALSLRRALTDPRLLGHAMGGPSWFYWRTVLIAAMGEPLTDQELHFYTWVAGRDHAPGRRVAALVLVVGRKGGKSRAMAVLAVYIACLCEHPSLVPGETGIVLIIAQNQAVARIVLDYVEGILRESPLLRSMLVRRTADAIELSNGLTIEVRAASYRGLRGPTYVAAICDEIAFWSVDESSANPDREIISAIKPALGLTNGMLILASSPYAKKGVLWELHQRHHGPHGDPATLCVQAFTRDLNPRFPQETIEAALAEDYSFYAAEYLAQFRDDITGYIDRGVIDACVTPRVSQRPPQPNTRYSAFCDPSAGASDSYCLAIAHRESGDRVMVDLLAEARAPFSPEAVTQQFAMMLRDYRIHSVVGDRFGGLWVSEMFARYSIRYEQSAAPKSDLYLALAPLLTSRRVLLLDNPRANAQLAALERRTARGGRDSVDHPPHGHDDLANVIAGAVTLANTAHRQRAIVATLAPPYADPNGEPFVQHVWDFDRQCWVRRDEQQRVRINWQTVDQKGNILASRTS